MWPLFTTREMLIQKRFEAGITKKSVLTVIQDTENILRTNPILTRVIPDANNPPIISPGDALNKEQWFTIVEQVPVIGSWETETKFRCKWVEVADGVDMEVFAGLGTRLSTRLRAKEVEGGVTEYSDHVTFRGLFFFMPFIVSSATRSHTVLRDIVAEKVQRPT